MEMNSRRTLAEITERVDAALQIYEQADDAESGRLSGIRRPAEAESSFAALAEAGRERVEVYVLALREISGERQRVLEKLKEKLEADRESAAAVEKEQRRGGDVGTNEEVMDEARLVQELDNLEALQRKIGARALLSSPIPSCWFFPVSALLCILHYQ